MKTIKLKTVLLGIGVLAASASFAQDTTGKPMPDTSKMPKHDTTSMIINRSFNHNTKTLSSSFSQNENVVIAKIEAINDESAKRYFAKKSA